MKRYFYSLFILVVLLPTFISSQTITGKLVDQNGNGLSGLQLQLYISPQVYNTTSSSNGTFTFNNVTDVKDEQLPTGYEISNNYPNPFNPKTRIGITLPNSGSVRVDVYNLLGQRVSDEIERYFSSGTNFIDVELNGLPNGFYLARITLDEKYIVTKKLMLLYGSQHLSSSSGGLYPRLSNTYLDGKSTLNTKIDSLVVTGSSITKKIFTGLPNMVGSSLNLGNLIITLPMPNAPTLSSPVDGAIDVSLSPTLTWNASTATTSYSLQLSTTNNFSSIYFYQNGNTNTNQQVFGLSSFTTYYWRVSATNSYGTSAYSSIWSFTTLGTPPATPTLASPANNAVDISVSPTLIWNAANRATSFILQVSTNGTFSSFVYNQSELPSTSQQVGGLNYSTKYYWRVSANNNYGTSSWSTPTWTFTTISAPCPGIPTITYEGKTYNTVQIGTQCWLKENLDVGTMIQGYQNASDNGTIEKYCYDNNPNNCTTYGGLYQWAEVVQYKNGATNSRLANPAFTGNIQGICPSGWHIPTKGEFQTLVTSVNNDGNALKAIGQGTGSGAGRNTSGFSALFTGFRYSNYDFFTSGNKPNFWSSTEYSADYADYAYYIYLYNSSSQVTFNGSYKEYGFSVRCLKD